MKKILLAAMAVIAFTACSQNEEMDNVMTGKEMKFTTAVMKSTRAGVMDNEKFTKFNLYAVSGTTAIIDNVTFTKSDNAWSSGQTFYWPADGSEVSFYGYSVETITDAAFEKATPAVTYTVKTAIADQEDLLVASATGSEADNAAGVSLTFNHVLSKMSFKVKGEGTSDITYTVTSIIIKAKAKGTYTYSNGEWVASADAAVDYTLTAPDAITGGAEATAIDGVLMMLPQEDAIVTVKYTYKANNITSAEKTDTLNFPAWTVGANTSYTITLAGAKGIVINASVAKDWEAAGTDTSFKE